MYPVSLASSLYCRLSSVGAWLAKHLLAAGGEQQSDQGCLWGGRKVQVVPLTAL